MGMPAVECESHVLMGDILRGHYLSRGGPVKSPLNPAAPSAKAKYY